MRLYFMLTVLSLAIGQAQSLLASEPFISEVVAANDNSLRDDFGDSPDWIEIHNPSDAPLNLGGWGLSDDLSDPHKWVFPFRKHPAARVPAGACLWEQYR